MVVERKGLQIEEHDFTNDTISQLEPSKPAAAIDVMIESLTHELAENTNEDTIVELMAKYQSYGHQEKSISSSTQQLNDIIDLSLRKRELEFVQKRRETENKSNMLS